MTGYELSRNWFDWAFENPDLNTPTHTALYMWFIEKWNRCGQKDKISITTSESMEVLAISSRNTFGKVFKDLCEWGFINVITDSKNQYSCKVISLAQKMCKQDESIDKALDKALIKQSIKQDESTLSSTDTINKQSNKVTIEQSNKVYKEISKEIFEARILELEKENQLLKEKKKKSSSGGGAAKFDFKQALINEGVEESIASDFMLVRKEKKAPSTETAFKLILNECERNQFSINEAIKTCINKNWQSFKYEWYVNLNTNGHSNNSFATSQQPANITQRTNLFGKDGKSANRLVEIGKRTPISELRRKTTFEVCEQ